MKLKLEVSLDDEWAAGMKGWQIRHLVHAIADLLRTTGKNGGPIVDPNGNTISRVEVTE